MVPCATGGVTCSDCHGSGERLRPLIVVIFGMWFNYDIAQKVLELPGLRVAPLGEGRIYFSFAGGDGMVQAMREFEIQESIKVACHVEEVQP